MNGWLYALLCVVAPAVWGALMYFAFGWVRRLRASKGAEGPPPADFTI